MNKETNPHVFALRPHHGLCLVFFEGKGYSEAFIKNMQHMLDVLTDEEAMVRLTIKNDEICSACPNQAGPGCLKEQLVSGYDRKVLALSGLKPETEISFQTFAASVQTNILSAGKLSQNDVYSRLTAYEFCETEASVTFPSFITKCIGAL